MTATGNVTAHLIPQLAFGINALSGKAKATINLDVDAQADLDLSLTGSGQVSKATDGSKSADKTLGGCVDVTSGLTVSAGADADFLSIFNKGTSVNLFQKTFDLFKKCFGSNPARRAYTGRAARAALLSKRQSIACPANALAGVVSIAEESIPASR